MFSDLISVCLISPPLVPTCLPIKRSIKERPKANRNPYLAYLLAFIERYNVTIEIAPRINESVKNNSAYSS